MIGLSGSRQSLGCLMFLATSLLSQQAAASDGSL
jgi:hypothetical protein